MGQTVGRELLLQPGDGGLVGGDLTLDLGHRQLVLKLVALGEEVSDGAGETGHTGTARERVCRRLRSEPRCGRRLDELAGAGDRRFENEEVLLRFDHGDLLVHLLLGEGGVGHLQRRDLAERRFRSSLGLDVEAGAEFRLGAREVVLEGVGRGEAALDRERRLVQQVRVALHGNKAVAEP